MVLIPFSGAIARHFRLEWQLQHGSGPFVWEVAVADDFAEITLISFEIPGLLARAAGMALLSRKFPPFPGSPLLRR